MNKRNTIRIAALMTMLSVGACASAPDLKNLPADALFEQGLAYFFHLQR